MKVHPCLVIFLFPINLWKTFLCYENSFNCLNLCISETSLKSILIVSDKIANNVLYENEHSVLKNKRKYFYQEKILMQDLFVCQDGCDR